MFMLLSAFITTALCQLGSEVVLSFRKLWVQASLQTWTGTALNSVHDRTAVKKFCLLDEILNQNLSGIYILVIKKLSQH